ncbi:hypothetical protein REPUB_Repub14bG0089800 [Reevesia pubescens]
MEWLRFLRRCATGRLSAHTNPGAVLEALANNNIRCSISYLEEISVLSSFNSFEDMDGYLKDHRELFESHFDVIIPWYNSSFKKEIVVWIFLKDVPLQIWHEKLFRSLGNRWGSFLKLDMNTEQRKRLDAARILVSIESRSQVPTSVSINLRCILFKIHVSIDDVQFESMRDAEYYSYDSDDYSDADCNFCEPDSVSYDDQVGGGSYALMMAESDLSLDNMENVVGIFTSNSLSILNSSSSGQARTDSCADGFETKGNETQMEGDIMGCTLNKLPNDGKLVVDLSIFGPIPCMANIVDQTVRSNLEEGVGPTMARSRKKWGKRYQSRSSRAANKRKGQKQKEIEIRWKEEKADQKRNFGVHD